MRVLLFVAAVSGASAAAPPRSEQAGQTQAQGNSGAVPEALSELARQLLRSRMERHGAELSELVRAVVLLQRARLRELAQAIASEPRITRPLPGSLDDLNAALPEDFFVAQDALRQSAWALAEASKSSKDEALALRFGELVQTCVSCHSAFLPHDAKMSPQKRAKPAPSESL